MLGWQHVKDGIIEARCPVSTGKGPLDRVSFERVLGNFATALTRGGNCRPGVWEKNGQDGTFLHCGR